MIITMASQITPEVSIDTSKPTSPIFEKILEILKPCVAIEGFKYCPYGEPNKKVAILIFIFIIYIFIKGLLR